MHDGEWCSYGCMKRSYLWGWTLTISDTMIPSHQSLDLMSSRFLCRHDI